MVRQKTWNISEAVILLEGLLLYRSGQLSKKKAIRQVSDQLRKMAENNGLIIDDVYRNTNGIAFQMSSMESALVGYTVMKPATRLFAETVKIYQSEPVKYKIILEEAKRVINGAEKPSGDNTVSDSYDSELMHTASYVALIRMVIANRFARGYQLNSILDLKRMRRYLEEQCEESLALSDEELQNLIRECGIQYNDRVFLPETMLSESLRDKLFDSIRTHFLEGKNVVYYEALFKEFSDAFLDHYVYNSDMLKAYLEFYNNGEFHLDKKYISKEQNTTVDPIDEVKNYLVSMGQPIESTKICAAISHIPQEKVMQILGMNAEFINNGKSYYFHVDIVHITKTELEKIRIMIAEEISAKQFLSGNELMEILCVKYPYIMECNSFLSMMGLRDMLKYYLRDIFSFRGNIISDINHMISMEWVFGNYARTHASFTRAELKRLAKEMNSIIYLETVYENALRISKDEFVSKEYAQFRIVDTDRVIEQFCPDKFIPLCSIQEFGVFPDAGYPWNVFLLEHFVYAYSRKFKLLHAGFNADHCAGAIVRKDSGIANFSDLLAIVLGESDVPLKKDEALFFCVENGYLTRRKLSDIEMILIQANTYRNKKGTH